MEVEILEIGATDLIRDLSKELTELKNIRKSNIGLKITVFVLIAFIVGGVIYYKVTIKKTSIKKTSIKKTSINKTK